MTVNYIYFYLSHPYLAYIFLGIFFLCIGSFLNVVIFRLPKMLELEYEKNCHNVLKIPLNTNLPDINLISTPSYCMSCKAKISIWNNIPIMSFIILRGKCSNCSNRISYVYPIVELLTMILSFFTLHMYGYSWQAFYSLLFIWISICLCFIDMRTKILPDCLTISLLWIGLVANINEIYVSLPIAIYGAIAGYLSLWIIINLYFLLTGKIGMGGGDFKLFAALGAWFGILNLPKILIISSILGLIFSSLYLIILHKSKNTPIPFGPFLAISGLIFLYKIFI